MKLAALLLLSLLVHSANAGTNLTISVASLHFQEGDYCSWNPGLGIEHRISSNWDLVAGQYSNSNCRASGYLGVSYSPLRFADWRLGTAIIGFTGYDKKGKDGKRDDKVIPALIGVLAYERKTWGLNILYIPPDGDDFRGAVGLQLKFPFR